jgi:hypothetical protein
MLEQFALRKKISFHVVSCDAITPWKILLLGVIQGGRHLQIILYENDLKIKNKHNSDNF